MALQSKLERADADLKRSRAKESQKDREIHHLEIFGENSRWPLNQRDCHNEICLNKRLISEMQSIRPDSKVEGFV